MADINDTSLNVSIQNETTKEEVTTSHPLTPGPLVSKNGLDVYITNPELTVSSGDKLVYDTMTIDQVLPNGIWTQIYLTTVPGKVYSIVAVFGSADTDIRLVVDTTIIANVNVSDIKSDYGLNANTGNVVQIPKFIYSYNNTGIAFELPAPAAYTTSFKIEARANTPNNSLSRGLIVRASS